jgi:hypothetical protein
MSLNWFFKNYLNLLLTYKIQIMQMSVTISLTPAVIWMNGNGRFIISGTCTVRSWKKQIAMVVFIVLRHRRDVFRALAIWISARQRNKF